MDREILDFITIERELKAVRASDHQPQFESVVDSNVEKPKRNLKGLAATQSLKQLKQLVSTKSPRKQSTCTIQS